MELADYLRVLRRRWWLVALAMLVGAGGAFGASLTQAPRYQSSTQLLIGGAANESDNQELVARQLAAQRAGAYSLLLPAPPAVAEVARRAGVPGAPAVVTATADGTSAYIDITVTAGSPQVAQKIAAAYGTATPEVVAMLEQRPGTASVRVTVTVEAALPSAPISPNPPRNAAIGLAIGLLVGLAGALAREALDARVRDSSEIERLTGATLLGSIPKEHGADVLPSVTRPRSGRAEAYRHVRTNLEFTSVDGMPRSVVVTSAAPGEGKSTTAANLAVVAARSGRNVVLVDADLRKPMVARTFGLQASVGLSDVLTGRWRWQEALVPVQGENLHVLASGAVPRFPSELVGSAQMARVIEELEQAFDFVIVDSPPVLPVSDALVIGVNVGGVVLVARMLETRRAALKRAVDAVAKVNAHLLGIVGNAVVKQEEKAYGEGYGYAYGYTSASKEEASAPPTVAPAERRPDARRRGRHADPVPPVPASPGSLDADAGLWPGPAAPRDSRAGTESPSQSYPQQPHPQSPYPGAPYPPQASGYPGYQGHPGYQQQPQQPVDPSWYPNAQSPAYPAQHPHPGLPPTAGRNTPLDGPAFAQQPVPPPAVRPGQWAEQPWGMPPQGSGPHSPSDALRLDDIIRQQRED